MTKLEELESNLELLQADFQARKDLIARLMAPVLDVAYVMGVVVTVEKQVDPKTGLFHLQARVDMARSQYSQILELEREIQIEQNREDTENDQP